MAEMKTLKDQRQQAKSALDRITALEKEFLPPDPKNPKDPGGRIWQIEQSVPRVIAAINQGFDTMRNQQSHATEIIDALTDLMGDTKVVEAVNANRVAKAVEMAKNRLASVEAALTAGHIEVEETIRACDPLALNEETGQIMPDENGQPREIGSFVAATEFAPDGTELPGSYYCMPMAKVKKEFQEKLVGQKLGFEFDTVPAFTADGVALTNPKLGEDGQPLMDKDGNPVTVPQMLKRKVVGVYKAVPPKPAEAKPETKLAAVPDPTPAEAPPAAPAAEATPPSQA